VAAAKKKEKKKMKNVTLEAGTQQNLNNLGF
jgi:hypothetical protein